MVANALFADGAAAVIVGAGDDPASPRLASFGSCIIPDSDDAMTWRIGDHGFEMTLSARVPDLIRAHLCGWLDPWLSRAGLSRDRIGGWAIHPGGPRIVGTVEQCLGLPSASTAASRAILAAHGNMSSPTVLFILQELIRRRAARPYIALGFGPGLVVEGMAIQ
jgi:predicted naringenin-chalcone synthase